MEFIQLAKDRYSLRQFSDKPVEKQKLDCVLEAGRLAPTACNNQPHRILVIESKEALAKLRESTPCHFNAPVALLVCYDRAATWKRPFDGQDSGDIDASIVTTQMMLQASELGLGTTWVGYFDPALIVKVFGLPETIVPVALLPLGYPAAEAMPNVLHNQRKSLDELVFYNDFSALENKQ